MLKQLFIMTFVMILSCCHVFSQAVPPRVQIVSVADTFESSPFNTATKTVNITLQLDGQFDAANNANNIVTFDILSGTLPVTPVFVNNTYALVAGQWPAAGQPAKNVVVPLLISLPHTDPNQPLTGIQVGQIIISGHPESFHNIVLTPPAYTPNKPFWVELGANFDLLDGLGVNNLTAGVFFHKRDIRAFRKGGTKNIGVFAGVFESESVTTQTQGEYGLHNFYDGTSFVSGKPSEFKLFKAIGPKAMRHNVRNIGLFFSPQLRLTNGSANDDGLHLFVALWMELQWQKLTTQRDYSNMIKIDSSMEDIANLGGYESKELKYENDIKSHYFGISLPIFFREEIKALDENVHLFINPVIGGTNQPTQDYMTNLIKNNAASRKWEAFYAIQFRLNEEKIGVAFTGEVRGLLKRDNAPFVSLAVTKKIDLTKFLMFK